MLISKLIAFCAAILQGGHDVEGTPSSKRLAIVGCHNDWESACNSIGVDGQWKRQ